MVQGLKYSYYSVLETLSFFILSGVSVLMMESLLLLKSKFDRNLAKMTKRKHLINMHFRSVYIPQEKCLQL